MKDGDIEQWYDDMYQMCLLAFLELDHLERKERVKKLKEDIQKNGYGKVYGADELPFDAHLLLHSL